MDNMYGSLQNRCQSEPSSERNTSQNCTALPYSSINTLDHLSVPSDVRRLQTKWKTFPPSHPRRLLSLSSYVWTMTIRSSRKAWHLDIPRIQCLVSSHSYRPLSLHFSDILHTSGAASMHTSSRSSCYSHRHRSSVRTTSCI
jgi:hypothetical protein